MSRWKRISSSISRSCLLRRNNESSRRQSCEPNWKRYCKSLFITRGLTFWLGGLRRLGDGLSQTAIGGDFALQLFEPRPRQFVVLGPPVVLCHSPFGLDPPLQLHPVERIERAMEYADLGHITMSPE